MTGVEVKIGRRRWRLEAYEHGWRVGMPQRENDDGGERLLDVSYFTTIEGVFVHCLEVGLRESGARSFEELVEAVRDLRADIRLALDAVGPAA